MGERYQQFLGSRPGIVVELIDDSASPYLVRTLDGFSFRIAAEDFRTYYRNEGSRTPKRWAPLVSDPETGTVDSRRITEVMEAIKPFQEVFKDFGKARTFVREALSIAGETGRPDVNRLSLLVEESGISLDALEDRWVERLVGLPEAVKDLLLSESCAEFQLPTGGEEEDVPSLPNGPESADPGAAQKSTKKKPPKPRRERMKNVEMSVEDDILTISVDLSQEFGPSKSGKTTIIASTEGNKSVPGREEKIGLNIYRQPAAKKPATGRRNSFKNVEMSLSGEMLTITTDLSKEFGPSKSGKTIIIASTEGNQLVYGREEKIGLNVYRKIE